MTSPRILVERVKDQFFRVRIEGEDDFLIELTDDEFARPTYIRSHVLHHREILRGRQELKSLYSTLQRVDKLRVEEERQPSPPAMAEGLMQLLGPKKSINAQLGDLQEMFNTNLLRFGRRRARQKYWLQVIRSIAPFVVQKLKRLGLIGVIIDYGRTKLGL